MKSMKSFESMWRKKELAQRKINDALQGYNLSNTAKDVYVFSKELPTRGLPQNYEIFVIWAEKLSVLYYVKWSLKINPSNIRVFLSILLNNYVCHTQFILKNITFLVEVTNTYIWYIWPPIISQKLD